MKKILLATVASLSLTIIASQAVNKEIEIKFQLSDINTKILTNWLEINAIYNGQQDQTECYFNNPNQSFFAMCNKGYLDALTALRVRMTNHGDWLCLKKGNVDPVTGKTISKDEYETKIEDGKTVIQLLEKLGYTEKIPVQKTRQIYTYDVYEIVIDDVVGLGVFMEVELKDNSQDAKAGQKRIKDFLKTMGLTSIELFDRSYIHMFKNPGFKFSETVIL